MVTRGGRGFYNRKLGWYHLWMILRNELLEKFRPKCQKTNEKSFSFQILDPFAIQPRDGGRFLKLGGACYTFYTWSFKNIEHTIGMYIYQTCKSWGCNSTPSTSSSAIPCNPPTQVMHVPLSFDLIVTRWKLWKNCYVMLTSKCVPQESDCNYEVSPLEFEHVTEVWKVTDF